MLQGILILKIQYGPFTWLQNSEHMRPWTKWPQFSNVISWMKIMIIWLTHCGLVMPYGKIELGQHCKNRTGSTLAQIMACCLMATSHYLNKYRLLVGTILWHSSEGIIIWRSEDTTINETRLKIKSISPKGQWVNSLRQSDVYMRR